MPLGSYINQCDIIAQWWPTSKQVADWRVSNGLERENNNLHKISNTFGPICFSNPTVWSLKSSMLTFWWGLMINSFSLFCSLKKSRLEGDLVQHNIADLEQKQLQHKQAYEEEIKSLKQQLQLKVFLLAFNKSQPILTWIFVKFPYFWHYFKCVHKNKIVIFGPPLLITI